MFILPSNPLYWLVALRMPDIGPVTFRRWLELFENNIDALFSASISDLQQRGFKAEEIALITSADWKSAEQDLFWLKQSECHLLTFQDKHYPELLRQVRSAPLVLFVKGNPDLLTKPQIAIVGSRHPTANGYETAMRFAKQLTSLGLVVTSGMALGIDAASHKGALSEGETIAVMGAGLKHIYPPANRKLAVQILDKGALVSEFLPDQLPQPKNFPVRNRVISGLSLGVLVVEAALRSGSLITAHDAINQGREVFAIPGSIHNPLARGCHYLLRQGAKLVETTHDILEELEGFKNMLSSAANVQPISSKVDNFENKQQQVYSQIGYETTALEAIIVRSGLTASEVSSILLSLELKGCARTVPGGYVRI